MNAFLLRLAGRAGFSASGTRGGDCFSENRPAAWMGVIIGKSLRPGKGSLPPDRKNRFPPTLRLKDKSREAIQETINGRYGMPGTGVDDRRSRGFRLRGLDPRCRQPGRGEG